jgi:hypothetical protein
MLFSWQRSELTCEGPCNDTLRGFYLLSWISFEYNSNMHEHLHIILLKQAYQRNNHHDYMGDIAKHNLWLQTLRRIARNMHGFKTPIEHVIILDKVNSQMSKKCYI